MEKNKKIYKFGNYLKVKILQLHDYLGTCDLNNLNSESEINTPYLAVFRWLLDVLLFGFFIASISTVIFNQPFSMFRLVGYGLLRWVVLDLIADLTKIIKG